MIVELEATPGRTCIINGTEYLFFSGYSYLGMNHVKEFKELVKDGVDKYGFLFPSSRISNTRLKIYKEFENELSSLTSMEDTVTFSSGFLAGKTIAAILSSYKNIFTAPKVHPAIMPDRAGGNLNKSFTEWSQKITRLLNESSEINFVLVSDSVDILSGEVYDFSFLREINSDKKIIVLIDDSHIIGVTQSPAINQLPRLNNIEYILSYSLSKAFNINGGAVSCSSFFAEKLRQNPNYTTSTSISPSLIYAFLKGKKLYESQRAKLAHNINYLLDKKISKKSLTNFFKLPVFICNKQKADEEFYKNNIIISSFPYPLPSSPKINRIVVSALHTEQDLDQLCSLL